VSNPEGRPGPQESRIEELFGVSGEDTDQSWIERFRMKLDVYLFTPARIAYSDWRARLGVALLSVYAVMLLAEPGFEKVFRNEAPPMVTPFNNEYLHTQTIELFGVQLLQFQFWQYPLGTDLFGQPLLARLVNATPAMFELVLAGSVVSVGLAVLIGTTAGYLGGFADDVLMGITDIVLTIPGLPLVLLLAAILQPESAFFLGMILAIDNWPGFARALRSQVLTIRTESYVESSRAMGVPSTKILREDIIPPLMPLILINAANAGKRVITEAVALYFLGLLPRGAPNWGKMMDTAYRGGALASLDRFYWILWPMLLLSLLSFGLILLSQGLDKLFNPRLRARHSSRLGGEGEELPEEM